MTGRYAHLHKWWQNSDLGTYVDENGKNGTWPLYKSSPYTIGHVAKLGGYATFWCGKTQMKNSELNKFGFDAVMTTPSNDLGIGAQNPHTDFRLEPKENVSDVFIPGGALYINQDTKKETKNVWPVTSFFWQPGVGTWNWPLGSKTYDWWPKKPEDEAAFGLSTYGPDIEMDFVFSFMEQAQAEGKPFFIYHCSHLGHIADNWIGQPGDIWYPGTPKIEWDGEKYLRTKPKVTGDKGVYNTHGTVTDPGIHHHINYLDY
jgi:arylsulfatase A-like enzyme